METEKQRDTQEKFDELYYLKASVKLAPHNMFFFSVGLKSANYT